MYTYRHQGLTLAVADDAASVYEVDGVHEIRLGYRFRGASHQYGPYPDRETALAAVDETVHDLLVERLSSYFDLARRAQAMLPGHQWLRWGSYHQGPWLVLELGEATLELNLNPTADLNYDRWDLEQLAKQLGEIPVEYQDKLLLTWQAGVEKGLESQQPLDMIDV